VTAVMSPSLIEAQARGRWYVVQPHTVQPPTVEWEWADTAAVGSVAWHEETVEVIVCQCGEDFKYKPPSGKTGCGYWSYFRLQKGTIPDGH
jgi:hypothetical protein